MNDSNHRASPEEAPLSEPRTNESPQEPLFPTEASASASAAGSPLACAAPTVDISWAERPSRALIRLAGPITVSMLSYSTMTMVSTAFVARVGADQLAGVGLAGILGFTLMCFGIGLARATKTLVSQSLGAGRTDRIDDYLAAGLALAAVLSVAASAAAFAIAPLTRFICASPAVAEHAATYLRIRMLGAFLVLGFATLRELRYGEGDTAGPMRASVVGNLVNLLADVLFILGLGWGVAGAAIATLLGNTTELWRVAWPMRRRLARLRLHRDAMLAVWRQGVPNGVQFILEVGSFLLLTAVIAGMSPRQGAAHQMVLTVMNVSFLPCHAIGESVSVLVGQAVGAGRFDLMRKVASRGLLLGASYGLFFTLLVALLGANVAGALSGDDRELAAVATTLLHVSMLFLVSDAANVVGRGALRGASDVKWAARVAVLTSWLATPPLAWLLGVHFGWGAAGGWIAIALEIAIGAALFWQRIVRGGWLVAAQAAQREVREIAPSLATELEAASAVRNADSDVSAPARQAPAKGEVAA
jgi:multidrug resistance protein, MATE family